MILADGNPSSGAEVARLADAFDAVPRVLAACAGFPFDETTPVDASAWTFQGGEFSLLWRDDARSYFGGAETSEESTFAGIAYYVLRPMMERDRLSTRRAALILALRTLRDRGSTLADLDAWQRYSKRGATVEVDKEIVSGSVNMVATIREVMDTPDPAATANCHFGFNL